MSPPPSILGMANTFHHKLDFNLEKELKPVGTGS